MDTQQFVASYTEAVTPLQSVLHRLGVARLTLLVSAKATAAARTAAADSLLDPALWTGRGVSAASIVEVYKVSLYPIILFTKFCMILIDYFMCFT